MEAKKSYPVSYYGGHVGAWLCVALAVAGIMYMLLIRGGGTKSMMVVLFLSLVLGLILAKDRKAYGDEMLKGLRESMVCVICVAFFMAGLLSALLKTSGLIEALIWVVAQMNVNTGFIPVIAFLVCVLISTACGTSTGTVTAVSAVMCPLAGELGIDMGLMCGAIISGSIFGDNLAPISDTTIASSQTQGASVNDVVRTRIPYSTIVGAISAVLYVVIGLQQSSGGSAVIEGDPTKAKSLIFLVLPIVLVYMMRRGWGLVSALLLSNALALLFSVVLGVIEPSVLFSDDSPVASGMIGMANVAIVFFGPFVKQLMSDYKDEADPCRSANILDGVACGTNGLIPHGNPALVITGVATSVAGVPASFSFLNFIGYTFHCWGLLIIFLLSILTGIGRKRKKENVQSQG